MKSQYPGGRIFGLDVMRTMGGMTVVLSHTSFLVGDHWPRFPMIPGIDWVALFFVLSGFLIGGILLGTAATYRSPLLGFVDFMQRRWLRTLPNYYLFLLLNILLLALGMAPGLLTHATPAYFAFLQNFFKPIDLFFWESWSLAVEEWFYLLFPLLLFTLMGVFSKSTGRAFLLVCLAFILTPIWIRLSLAGHVHDATSWDLWVNKFVPARLDAPGYGMLAAWSAHRWPKGWRQVRWIAMPASLILLWFTFHHPYAVAPRFATFALKSQEALALALWLPLFSTWHVGGRFAGTFKVLSLVTYAQYLVHMPLLYLMGSWVKHPVASTCALRYALFFLLVELISIGIYFGWELPFMRLRPKVWRWLDARWPRPAGRMSG